LSPSNRLAQETKLVNRRLLPKETVEEFECAQCGAEFFFRDFEKRPPKFCPECGRRNA